MVMLANGTIAPDFKLNATPDKSISLSDFKGKNVVLAFYPADWSPVCTDELSLYNQSTKLFEKNNTVILGISVDSKWSHLAFSQARNIHFNLLSDFEPKGAVSRLYGAYNEENGYSKRALYLIDKNGLIAWSYLSPDDVNPGVDGILDALDELQSTNK